MGSAVLKTVARRAKRLGCVRFTYVPATRYQRFCARGLAACRKGAVLFLCGSAVSSVLSPAVFAPTPENPALATGPNPVPAVAVAVDIPRKRTRRVRRIVKHTAKARPVMLSTTSTIIVSFDSTFDVMECEQLCLAAGVPGRIMCPQCGGLEHVDETASKHVICTSGAQKRFYLHRNQNETSARRLMRNFAATVRYYPYTIKFAAHRVP